jgi:hypothetical protein
LTKKGKYTAEHDELLRDVVTSFSGKDNFGDLYQVFKKLLSDLEMDPMPRCTFRYRAVKVRCIGDTDSQENHQEESRDEEKEMHVESASAATSSGKIPEEYKTLLARASDKMETEPSLKQGKKYSSLHVQLMMDVVKTFKDAGVSGQYDIFKQLTADLGIREMPRNTFNSRASAVRKHKGNCSQRKLREPKVGFEASKQLQCIFQENPRISTTDAFKAVESYLLSIQAAGVPSMKSVSHWLYHRRATLRYVDQEQVGKQATGDGQPSTDSVRGSDTYSRLLENATQRKGRYTDMKTSLCNKYTAEHDDLIFDVVESSGEYKKLGELYELFSKLSQDLNLVIMSRRIFNERVSAARKYLYGGVRQHFEEVSAMGIANSELLDSLFEQNPKLSEADAFTALKSVPRDTEDDSSVPSIAMVRSWLGYRRRMRRFVGRNAKSLSDDPNDENLWTKIFLDLATDRGDDQMVSSTSAISHTEYDSDEWREIALSLAEKQADDMVVSSTSALPLIEEREDDEDLLNEMSGVLVHRLDDDVGNEDENTDSGFSSAQVDKGPGARTGSSVHQACGKRKRND